MSISENHCTTPKELTALHERGVQFHAADRTYALSSERRSGGA